MAAIIAIFRSLKSELGFDSIWNASRDTKILCLQRFCRFVAYGASTLVLALYLKSLGFSEARIGLFMTVTLLGDAFISLCLTLFADGLGRRRILVMGAALMSAGSLAFVMSANYWILQAASILGVISPSGKETGPFKAIEESTLAQLTPSAIRSDIFAWYSMMGTVGTACGTIASGWIVGGVKSKYQWTDLQAYRLVFGCCALLGAVKLLLSLILSDQCEPAAEKMEHHDDFELDSVEAEGLLSDEEEDTRTEPSKPKRNLHTPGKKKSRATWPSISPSSRTVLVKLCLLFAVDSFASGLVPQSWITYFFKDKFSLPEGYLGTLFFSTNLVASVSQLVASSISKRIGLIKTMALTHLPSAVFLSLIPLPSSVALAITFLVLRASTQSMDQAPRQAFLAAVVLPNERTAVMGVVNVVKNLSQSGGPVTTGWLAGLNRFWISFLIAGSLKVVYDLTMLRMFLGHRMRDKGEDEEETHRHRDVQRPESSEDRLT